LQAGLFAAAATGGALLAFGMGLHSPALPFNLAAHVILGDRATVTSGVSPLVTLSGIAVHVTAIAIWGLLYSWLAGGRPWRVAIPTALLFGAVVFLLNTRIFPEALRPGGATAANAAIDDPAHDEAEMARAFQRGDLARFEAIARALVQKHPGRGPGWEGIGFLAMIGAVYDQAAHGKANMWWLVLAYLFHTMGELCISPVGLSMVTKLAPLRLASLMMGVWFLINFVANWLAGIVGSYAVSKVKCP
jgi:hypothetical protein